MLKIFLTILFVVFGLFCFYLFFFKKPKLHPLKFFLGIWFCTCGISQLLLSDFEKPWTFDFWALVLLSFTYFTLGSFIANYFGERYLKKDEQKIKIERDKQSKLKLAIFILVGVSILANLYIYLKIGTLPLFSSDPDNLRFIINRHIFGLFEYLALAARIYIPLSCLYLFLQKRISKKDIVFSSLVIVFGLATLIIYMSRITIFFR